MLVVGAWAAVVTCGSVAGGAVIGDRAFFESRPHTLLNFEARGDGTVVSPDLGFNEFEIIQGNEYSAADVRFEANGILALFKTGSPSDRDALRIGGSLDIILARGGVTPESTYEILFGTPVRAAGFFTLTSDDLPGPEFEAFSASGELLGSFGLSGDLQDGIIDGVAFGYIGIATDEPIARIALANGAVGWGIDDLRFSAIPAPGSAAVIGLGAIFATARRRR